MKNPESNNDKTVKNQLKKAVGMAQKEMQSSRVIISNVRSGRSADQMAEVPRSFCRWEEYYRN